MTMQELLQAGRLSQVCPDCGLQEAAGAYCTRCLRPMSEQDWQSSATEAQQAALARARLARQDAPRPPLTDADARKGPGAAIDATMANPGPVGLWDD